MLARDPTFLGEIAGVSSATVRVRLAPSVASGLSIIHGRVYKIGQVGSFVRIPQGYQDLFGVVSAVGADAMPDGLNTNDTGRWMEAELVGEALGGTFERGVSQYPNIGDYVHLAVEQDIRAIYDRPGEGNITIGSLSSAESIPAKVALNELITRHSALLGSTGSGKSTTVASLVRAITSATKGTSRPSARVLLLDVHGEYAAPLSDVATVFSVEPNDREEPLHIPYWALAVGDLLEFLTGGVTDMREAAFTDKIVEFKLKAHDEQRFPGVSSASITVDTPLPFSLKRLWYDLIDIEIATFEGENRDQPARQEEGDPDTLIAPSYKPHGLGNKGPFLNPRPLGIRRQLGLLRSRLLDRRFDFLLHPGKWEPVEGKPTPDLDELLAGWLGSDKPVTVLDLSGIPSAILERLVGAILKIVYEALFWSREKAEGGIERPLLVVMEEAHRYLGTQAKGLASDLAQRIAKEGRKYGVGAMVISQRPSEVDETVLSQCGTFFALRLSNPDDRARVRGTLPDGLTSLLDVLPVLRTGEAVVTGEAAKLPMRCRVELPAEEHRPRSEDPAVSTKWALKRRAEGYDRVVASWRAQSPRAVVEQQNIERVVVSDVTPTGDFTNSAQDVDNTEGVVMLKQSVASTNLMSVGYDERTQTLEVEFLNGRVYQYYGVPDNMHDQLMRASSKGRFFNTYIRNSYPFSRVG